LLAVATLVPHGTGEGLDGANDIRLGRLDFVGRRPVFTQRVNGYRRDHLWPALSFSQRGVANGFGSIYTRGTDFVITVGTANPRDNPAHRQSLMSLVDVAPNIIVNTAKLVDPEVWATAQQTHPGRWKLSMPIFRCWTFNNFPDARTDMAATYRKFANPSGMIAVNTQGPAGRNCSRKLKAASAGFRVISAATIGVAGGVVL
jgi:hypothetical protein